MRRPDYYDTAYAAGLSKQEIEEADQKFEAMMDCPEIHLPHLGKRTVREVKKEPGHWEWLDFFGWHDCSPDEDKLCNETFKTETSK